MCPGGAYLTLDRGTKTYTMLHTDSHTIIFMHMPTTISFYANIALLIVLIFYFFILHLAVPKKHTAQNLKQK